MTECIFCKIIKGDIPSEIVYEDEAVVGFLDIRPIYPGHTLLVPRRHSADLLSATEEDRLAMMKALPIIAKAIMAATKADAFNIGFNNGRSAGQIVEHLHAHVIPRSASDRQETWTHGEYQAGEASAMAERIRVSLKSL